MVGLSEFTIKVMKVIRSIPKGKVATYKQVAEISGKPQASRGVAWILHSCSTAYKLPWHRVLNSQGKISFEPQSYNFRKQRKLLQHEGVIVSPEGSLDLDKFKWKKKATKLKSKRGEVQMFR